jgi:hypothetical protein
MIKKRDKCLRFIDISLKNNYQLATYYFLYMI